MKRPLEYLPPIHISVGALAYAFAVLVGTVLLWGDGDSRALGVFAMIFLALFTGVPTFYLWDRAADRANLRELREQAERAGGERLHVPDYPPSGLAD